MPSNFKYDADLPQIANTTVLRFGESHLMCVSIDHVIGTLL